MKSMSVSGLVSMAVVLIALTGCATAKTGGPCTLVGCEPGLSIDIRGDRGGDITVKIVAADGQQKTFECDADAPACTTFFADYTPERVSVTVTKKESNVVRSFEVTYRNEHPNGEDCPPVCKQGHIDMNL